MMVKEKMYSCELSDIVEAKLPKPIRDAMKQTGWNAFGIYELVRRELAEEKKRTKTK
jgi:hypothetical protein